MSLPDTQHHDRTPVDLPDRRPALRHRHRRPDSGDMEGVVAAPESWRRRPPTRRRDPGRHRASGLAMRREEGEDLGPDRRGRRSDPAADGTLPWTGRDQGQGPAGRGQRGRRLRGRQAPAGCHRVSTFRCWAPPGEWYGGWWITWHRRNVDGGWIALSWTMNTPGAPVTRTSPRASAPATTTCCASGSTRSTATPPTSTRPSGWLSPTPRRRCTSSAQARDGRGTPASRRRHRGGHRLMNTWIRDLAPGAGHVHRRALPQPAHHQRRPRPHRRPRHLRRRHWNASDGTIWRPPPEATSNPAQTPQHRHRGLPGPPRRPDPRPDRPVRLIPTGAAGGHGGPPPHPNRKHQHDGPHPHLQARAVLQRTSRPPQLPRPLDLRSPLVPRRRLRHRRMQRLRHQRVRAPHNDETTHVHVEQHLAEMTEDAPALIRFFEVDGKRYAEIIGFREHQTISKPSRKRNPTPSHQRKHTNHHTTPGALLSTPEPSREHYPGGSGSGSGSGSGTVIVLWSCSPAATHRPRRRRPSTTHRRPHHPHDRARCAATEPRTTRPTPRRHRRRRRPDAQPVTSAPASTPAGTSTAPNSSASPPNSQPSPPPNSPTLVDPGTQPELPTPPAAMPHPAPAPTSSSTASPRPHPYLPHLPRPHRPRRRHLPLADPDPGASTP